MTSTTIFAIHNRFLWIQAIVCIVFSSKPSQCQELDVSSTITQIRAGFERLQQFENELKQIEITQTVYAGPDTKTGTATMRCFRQAKCIMMEFNQLRVIRNESEQFSVKRSKQANAWQLTHHKKSSADETWQVMLGDTHLSNYPLTAVTSSWTVFHVIRDTSFLPKNLRRISENLVEMSYEFKLSTTTDKENRTLVKGTMLLRSDLNWLPVKSIIVTVNESFGEIKSTLERTAIFENGKVMPVSATFACGEPGTPFYNKSVFAYREHAVKIPSSEEFYLAYYSIVPPEYDDVFEDRAPFKWFLWVSIGLFCIALSVVLRNIVRRNR